MTPAATKRLAAERKFYFLWNAKLQMWACYPFDLSREATYHTKSTLRPMTPDQFIAVYLQEV